MNYLVRRTRSGKAKATPSPKVAKTTKASSKGESKPSTRRTRKKVVLMEVEVSEEEEDTNIVENSGDDRSEVNEGELEDKLLASPEVSNDATDVKTDNTEIEELNGEKNVGEEKSQLDDSIMVVSSHASNTIIILIFIRSRYIFSRYLC